MSIKSIIKNKTFLQLTVISLFVVLICMGIGYYNANIQLTEANKQIQWADSKSKVNSQLEKSEIIEHEDVTFPTISKEKIDEKVATSEVIDRCTLIAEKYVKTRNTYKDGDDVEKLKKELFRTLTKEQQKIISERNDYPLFQIATGQKNTVKIKGIYYKDMDTEFPVIAVSYIVTSSFSKSESYTTSVFEEYTFKNIDGKWLICAINDLTV